MVRSKLNQEMYLFLLIQVIILDGEVRPDISAFTCKMWLRCYDEKIYKVVSLEI